MKTILALMLILAMSIAVHAIPPNVSPRIERLKGTVTEIVPITKGGDFSFVRLNVEEGTDDKILLEIFTAIRKRTNFNIHNQRRPKKGEALIVIDRANRRTITPIFRVGDVITISGYGITDPERPRDGEVSYSDIKVGK